MSFDFDVVKESTPMMDSKRCILLRHSKLFDNKCKSYVDFVRQWTMNWLINNSHNILKTDDRIMQREHPSKLSQQYSAAVAGYTLMR